MRYLGIDYGTKKVGLALSDEAGTMGFPSQVLPNDAGLLEAVRALAQKEGVGALVMGESRAFDGSENPVMEEARAFGARLSEAAGLPLHFEPELFTTQEARRDPTGAYADKGVVDASAAALILSSYLAKTNPRPDPGPNLDI